MKLGEIVPPYAHVELAAGEPDVGGLSADSRAVKAGDVFVAIEGGKTDGLKFAESAIAAGATAIVA